MSWPVLALNVSVALGSTCGAWQEGAKLDLDSFSAFSGNEATE